MLDEIVAGDARELSLGIPDNSVDLILTDPVYDNIGDYRWLVEMAARVLKPDRACLAFQQIGQLQATLSACDALPYRWTIAHVKQGRVKEKFGPAGFSKWEAVIWWDKGRVPRRRFMDVINSVPFNTVVAGVQLPALPDVRDKHVWSKDPDVMARIIQAFTKPGDIVCDPFCGGGSVQVACRLLDRRFIAFEIDPEIADRARAYLRTLPTRLPMPIPEQQELPYGAGEL